MIALEVGLVILIHIAVLAGLAAVVLGLSGNFILLGVALLTAWLGGFQSLTWTLLVVLAGLAILGEVLESLLGVATARGFGATRWGMLGTFVGGLLGAIVGTAWMPVLGSLAGAFVGAFAGAFAAEFLSGHRAGESARAGTGALLGRAAATVLKLGIGFVIGFFTLRAAYALI